MFSSVTPWAVAHKAPLSIGFLRQEYWNGLPFPSPGHLPTPGTEPMFLTFPTLAGSSLVPPGKDFKNESVSYSVTLSNPKEPTRLLWPWNSPGKNTGVDCYSLLQGSFPTSGSNPTFGHYNKCIVTVYYDFSLDFLSD